MSRVFVTFRKLKYPKDLTPEVKRRILKRWGEIYRTFLYNRYEREGDGSWPPLAEATIRKKGHAVILRDTDTLITVLEPVFNSAPGAIEIIDTNAFSIRIGYGTGALHPKAKTTIAEIASFHQLGTAKMPARPIMIRENYATRKQRIDYAMQEIAEFLKNKRNRRNVK